MNAFPAALAAVATAVLIGGAATTQTAIHPVPKTITTETGRIHAVAQDANAIAWIGAQYRVRVRRLSPARTYLVGSGIGSYAHVTHPLALAGLQALWTTADAGNFIYTDVHTGSPSLHDRVVFNLSYMPGPPDGLYLEGMGGAGSTLVFGATAQRCDSEVDCRRIDVDGHVQRVTTNARPIAGLPAPFLLATSRGRIALVPAKAPRFPPDLGPPRAAEYAPVQVYDGSGNLISTVVPPGTPRAVALDWPKLAVLFEFVDGTKQIQLYDARTGGYWIAAGEGVFTRVPVTVDRVSVGTPGAVYSVGSAIYLLRKQQPQLVWRAAGTPVGLSISGNRLVWGENSKGHGRVKSLTVR